MGKIKLASSSSLPGGSIVKVKGNNWYEGALSSIDKSSVKSQYIIKPALLGFGYSL